MHDPVFLVGLAVLGAVVGYASGLFGVGGGFMLTPLLIALFGVRPEVAVGSGLAQMIGVGATGAWRHSSKGYVDARAAAVMAPGTLVGTYLGKAILQWLAGFGVITIAGRHEQVASLVLSILFILLLVGVAVRLWRENGAEGTSEACAPLCWPNGPCRIALPASGISAVSLVSLTGAGLLIGIMAGLLGIGGGVILVPLLVYGYGMSLRMAIGTSSLLVLVSAISGTVQYTMSGMVDWWIVLALLAGSLLGVQIGAWHCHRLAAAHLQRAFALLVLFVAMILVAKFVV